MSRDCECLLNKRREVRYFGNQNAKIVVVGESPGRNEEIENKPFVGMAGKLLKDQLGRADIDWSEVMALNSARCLIDKENLSRQEIKSILNACRPNIESALLHIKPKVIIPLGDIALQQILKKSGITKHRGHWYWSEEFNCWVMPTFHPSYCLRSRDKIPIVVDDLIRVKELENRKWVREAPITTNYRELTTKEEFEEYYEMVKGEIVGVDSETMGLDWMSKDVLMICFTMSHAEGEGIMVRLIEECSEHDAMKTVFINRSPKGSKKKELSPVYIRVTPWAIAGRKLLMSVLADEAITKVMCNGNFDQHFFQKSMPSYKIENYGMDVQAAAHVLDENRWTQASLEGLQFAYTDMRDDYSSQFDSQFNKADMLSVPNDKLMPYAIGDSDCTRRVAVRLAKELKEPDNERLLLYFRRFVQPVVSKVLYEMEKNGSGIDIAALPQAKAEITEQIQYYQRICFDLIPDSVKEDHEGKLKLTRDELIRDILFSDEGFKLKPIRITPTKKASVDKDTVQALLDKKLPKRAVEFLEAYEYWNRLNKLYTTYICGIEKSVKSDGRIHSQYSLVKAATGRTNCSGGFNLQTIPKRSKEAKIIRRLIVPAPGFRFISLDAAQSELRWIAHVAEDTSMMQVFREGKDIHTETASDLAGVDVTTLQKEELDKYRFRAKCSNFGNIYGMGSRSFVKYAKRDYGLELTLKEGEDYQNKWFSKYPNIKVYHEKTRGICARFGYVESPLGRRRRLPEINSSDPYLADRAWKMAINHRIQSASSDTPLLAILTLLEKGLLNPKECRFVNFVHDDIVVECLDNDSIAERYYKMIKDAMENPPLHIFGIKMKVPLVSDGKMGYNLAEMHSI